jgi:hypothetical protein
MEVPVFLGKIAPQAAVSEIWTGEMLLSFSRLRKESVGNENGISGLKASLQGKHLRHG